MRSDRRWISAAATRTLVVSMGLLQGLYGQTISLNWDQVETRVLMQNPSALAGELNIQESRANEITAGLRPNPQFDLSADGFQLFPSGVTWRPLATSQFTPAVSQLIERGHKRQLREDSARLATSGAGSDQEDLKRNLIFNARSAFVTTLQAKALLDLAQANLQYYDNVIDVNRSRFQAGDISELDFQRVEIQRVQFESDLTTARVNVRTAKILLLALLNDRTPSDDFDVTGDFNYRESVLVLPELRQIALQNRPDLRSAQIAIEKARSDNRVAIANGTADPVIGGSYFWNPQLANPQATSVIGASISIPIRIFDKNQGEKQRTALEIQRTERLRDALMANVYRDADSAFATVESVRDLLRPYRDKYLQESADIRDKVSFSYNQGNSTLLDFLDAQRSYRDTQVAYVNLEGSYWNALAQLSLAVGQEVNP